MEQQHPGRKFFYEVALSKVQRQDAWNRDLESKAIRYSAAATAVMGFVAAAFEECLTCIALWKLGLAGVAFLAFVGSVYSAWVVLRARNFHNTPNLSEFRDALDTEQGFEEDNWAEWVGGELTDAYEANRKTLDLKGRWIERGGYSTAVALIVGLAAAAVLRF